MATAEAAVPESLVVAASSVIAPGEAEAQLPPGYERITGLGDSAYVIPTAAGTTVILGENHPVVLSADSLGGGHVFLRFTEIALPQTIFQSDEKIGEKGIELKYWDRVDVEIGDPDKPGVRVYKALNGITIQVPDQIQTQQKGMVSFADLDGPIVFGRSASPDMRVSVLNKRRGGKGFAVPDWSHAERVSWIQELDDRDRKLGLSAANKIALEQAASETAELTAVGESAKKAIEPEVLLLRKRADRLMTAFFADPQKRGHEWGDIVDRSNRVDLDDFISYRRNLVLENWRDENQQQIADRLIQEMNTLVNMGSRAQHHIYHSEFARTYVDALLEISKKERRRIPNEFKLGYSLMGVQTGVPIAMKYSLFFACAASEYGNLALSETDTYRREVFLQRARFFHQASLYEGKLSGDTVFSSDESIESLQAVVVREGEVEAGAASAAEAAAAVVSVAEAPMAEVKTAEVPDKFIIPEGYDELPRIGRVPFYFPEKHPDKSPSFPIYIGSHRVNAIQDYEGVKLVFLEMLEAESHVELRVIGRSGQVERTEELDLGFIPLEAETQILINGYGGDGENVIVVDDNLREETSPLDSNKIKKVLVVKIPRILRTEKEAVDFSDIDPLLHAIITHSKDGTVSVQRASEKAAIYVPSQLIEALREAGSRFVPSATRERPAGALTSLGEAREGKAEVEAVQTQVKVDSSRLIGPEDVDQLEQLIEVAGKLSEYQKGSEFLEDLKMPGRGRETFIMVVRDFREIIHRLEPELQKKVLRAALGEQASGSDLVALFDRGLDALFRSWGMDR